jgi:hypothetical protein
MKSLRTRAYLVLALLAGPAALLLTHPTTKVFADAVENWGR